MKRYSECYTRGGRDIDSITPPKNTYIIHDEYITGYASNTQAEFLIDPEDLDRIKDSTWSQDAHGYMVTTIKRKKIKLHRFILNTTSPAIDHINGNKLDNRKSNLREVTTQQNEMNRRSANKNNKLGVKGVHQVKNGRYKAEITKNGKNISIGTYATLEQAKAAREAAERFFFGDYAYKEGEIS